MKKIAIVTGASSGLGEAIAFKLAELGYNLILTARRKEKLEDVSQKVKEKFNTEILPLCFDITKYTEVQNNLGNLPKGWDTIDLLVNNAGLALGLSPIYEGEIEDWDRMIDTNIKGLLYATRVISPKMVELKKGHIINIGSVAGKDVYPNGNVYCATKHAVDSLNKSMRIELYSHNIRVTQICPGAVETEFSLVRFKGDKDRADKVYTGYKAMVAKDVADTLGFIVTAPNHVNVQDIIVAPTGQGPSPVK